MLGTWTSHADYQQFVTAELSAIAKLNSYAILEYRDAIAKVFILNLDPLEKLIASLYSVTGRPSKNQSEIFCSLILMACLGLPLDKWVGKLLNNPVLQIVLHALLALFYL